MSVGVGTGDVTVGDVIERLYLTWLRPPEAQPMYLALGADILDATTQTVSLGAFAIVEDQDLLRQGSLLAADHEIMRVVAYDQVLNTVTGERGQYNTVAVAHSTPLLMVMNPVYSRPLVWEAVADNIITLYPKLSTVRQEYLTSVGGTVFPLSDELAVDLLTAWGDGWTGTRDAQGTIVDFHQLAGGRAIILNEGEGSMWFRYRRRMGKPTDETTKLEDIGVDERWVSIVMAGAAGDLMAGKDITASHTEWIKSVLEAETIRVGTRMSIAGGLRQYRNMLIDDASKEMKAEYRPKVRMRTVTG